MPFKIKTINVEVENDTRLFETPSETSIVQCRREVTATIRLVGIEGDEMIDGAIDAMYAAANNQDLVEFHVMRHGDNVSRVVAKTSEDEST